MLSSFKNIYIYIYYNNKIRRELKKTLNSNVYIGLLYNKL